ncbi:MAG: signal peptide peptidase SppA [Candidatus Cloacimonadota bacterium]|nr:MAG: signal peptide peptidase SppA [Candidatus Cloacimonadota bacterium]PIE81108.1 MAG: signal peptide peptidase SppA [Candidatus Delongbacteria bacterium]
MFRFFKWFFKTILTTLLRLIVLILFLFIIATVFINKNQPDPEIYDNSLLKLSFPIVVNDFGTDDVKNLAELSLSPIMYRDYLNAINHSRFDSKIKGLYINLDAIHGLGKEQMEELILTIVDFKKSGKKVYAYGEYITSSGYEIAVVADSILMPGSTSAMLNLTGFSKSFIYYKDLLEKFGVKTNVIHAGDFKSYGENYSKSKMSEQFKSEINKIYDERFKLFIEVLSRRFSDSSTLEKDILSGKFAMLTPSEAKEFGLIDEITTPTALIEEKKLNKFSSISDYARSYMFEKKFNSVDLKDEIAILYAEGNIVSSFDRTEDCINPTKLVPIIKELREDDNVKAVILRVNSGGGSALSSELIYQELKKLADKKELVVSMGNIAASGGYYISTPAKTIYAGKNTITGSIGVVAMLPQFSKTAEMLGLNIETVNLGKFGSLYSPLTGFEEGAEKLFMDRLFKTYDEFKSRVMDNRNISPDSIESIAGGRIWTGTQAVNIGLVDKIGYLNDIVDDLKKEYGDLKVTTYPKPLSLLDRISSRFDKFPLSMFGDEVKTISKKFRTFKSLSGEILFHTMIEDLK